VIDSIIHRFGTIFKRYFELAKKFSQPVDNRVTMWYNIAKAK